MSAGQEETSDFPKPPFESAPSGNAETEDEAPASRGFGGRGDAHSAPAVEEPSVPPPPFEASGSAPVTQSAAPEQSFPPPPFEASTPEPSMPEHGVSPPIIAAPPPPSPVKGSITFQDPENTPRHEPTLAESRARYQAEQEEARQREEEELQAEHKRKWRRRLIGSVAVVGVVGLVALVYIASPEQRCYDDVQRQEVPSYYCSSSYHSSGVGGIFFFHSTGWWGSPPSGYHGLTGGYSGSSGSSGKSGSAGSNGSNGSNGSVEKNGFNPSGKGSGSS